MDATGGVTWGGQGSGRCWGEQACEPSVRNTQRQAAWPAGLRRTRVLLAAAQPPQQVVEGQPGKGALIHAAQDLDVAVLELQQREQRWRESAMRRSCFAQRVPLHAVPARWRLPPRLLHACPP